jgi:hypothetical protein
MRECRNRHETVDHFGFLVVFSPDFPADLQTTLAEEFDILKRGIAMIEAKTKKPDALRKLKECRDEVEQAIACFDAGDVRGGKTHLMEAEELFRTAR